MVFQALQPLPAPDRARERRCSRRCARTACRARRPSERARELLARFGLGGREDDHPDRSPAASSSAWRSSARSPRARARCCSTRSPARSTPSWSARCSRSSASSRREGMTMLIATHEMGFAREVADEVCFLHEGRDRSSAARPSGVLTRARAARDAALPAPAARRRPGLRSGQQGAQALVLLAACGAALEVGAHPGDAASASAPRARARRTRRAARSTRRSRSRARPVPAAARSASSSSAHRCISILQYPAAGQLGTELACARRAASCRGRRGSCRAARRGRRSAPVERQRDEHLALVRGERARDAPASARARSSARSASAAPSRRGRRSRPALRLERRPRGPARRAGAASRRPRAARTCTPRS